VTGVFRANNPYNTFLLFLYGLLLKLPMFLQPKIPQPQQIDGFLYKAFLKWLQPIGNGLPVLYPLIAFLLLYFQAVNFNKLVSEQRLLQNSNYLTGMSYLLLTSLFTEWNMLSSPLIVNSVLLWVWAKLSSLHTINNIRTTLFNIGAAIGISTFFYFPSIAFAALIIFGLAITRPFKLAEWLMVLIGVITPYYFLLAFVFVTDRWKGYKFPGVAFTAPKFSQTNWAYTAIGIVLFASVIGYFFIQKNFRRFLIQTRKSWNLLFLYLFIAILVPFINAIHTFEYWILCAIPLSAFMASAFYYPPKKIFPLFLHWLIILFVVALNYYVR
jgi:hypothetical protein